MNDELAPTHNNSFGIEQRMAELNVDPSHNQQQQQEQQQQQHQHIVSTATTANAAIPIQQQQQPPPQQQQQQQQQLQPQVQAQAQSQVQPQRRNNVTNANHNNNNRSNYRPYDDLGVPAQNPREFGPSRYGRGNRHNVLCYIPIAHTHKTLSNVLFRERPSSNIAYYPSPYKEPIKTIMGHVEICNVLERIKRQKDDDDDSDFDSDDDDIVFQWTEKRVAVKVNVQSTMDRLRGQHAEDPMKEIAAMQLIGTAHPNVLGCIDSFYDGCNLNVIMPFCNSGDLFQLLQDTQEYNAASLLRNSSSTTANTTTTNTTYNPPGLSEGQCRYWFRQIIAGIQFMHTVAGVCHRDLSPENVMIDQNRFGVIIDMGMALRVPYQVYHEPLQAGSRVQITDLHTAISMGSHAIPTIAPTIPPTIAPTIPAVGDTANLVRRRCLILPQGTCGKMPYMCPEIYRNRESFDGEAADIWTAGTILFCMITGNRSYQRPHNSDPQFYWMTNGLEQLLKDWNVSMSTDGIHLLKNMLQINPRTRISLNEIITHPWFTYPDEIPIAITTPTENMELDLDDDSDDD